MNDSLAALANRPFSRDGRITRMFRAAGVDDFMGVARHVLGLPYGRIADRAEFWRALSERRGTCTTKHALLAALAREQQIEVQLTLGIFAMNEGNTPGVERVLERYGLTCVPEAHCHLRHGGERIDVTGVPAGAEPMEEFLHEEPITLEQIGASQALLAGMDRARGGWTGAHPRKTMLRMAAVFGTILLLLSGRRCVSAY